MRNAVLAAMAEMVLQVLSGDQLEVVSRDTRDQFLDTLQAHCHDVNSLCAQPRFAALHPNCPAEGEAVDVTEIHRTLYAGRSKKESSCVKEESTLQGFHCQ